MKERTTNAWLSIGAYARTYGISRPTVKKWLTAGLLETYRFMGVIRIKNLEPAQHQKQPFESHSLRNSSIPNSR